MDFRKVFDGIPEQFDQWRSCYCGAAFRDIIAYALLDASKSALELGPGTGQATEPILMTGCDYLAIELGEHLAEYTRERFKRYDNFHIVNADYETYDFGDRCFNLVFSAATIQWIPEEIAFGKTYALLKSGGTLAMMATQTGYKEANPVLYN